MATTTIQAIPNSPNKKAGRIKFLFMFLKITKPGKYPSRTAFYGTTIVFVCEV
jgi:hypothetical protein